MKPSDTPKIINQDAQIFFQELLGGIDASNVLDVACGPGGLTGLLKAKSTTWPI